MSLSYREYQFLDRVRKAQESVRKLLDSERDPELASEVYVWRAAHAHASASVMINVTMRGVWRSMIGGVIRWPHGRVRGTRCGGSSSRRRQRACERRGARAAPRRRISAAAAAAALAAC